jgi:protoporphyrinogen oxidase
MTSRASTTPIAVLGAGLTGMSAAFHLGRAGVPHRIFERLGHPGGHAITIEDSGYRFDRTGHLLHLRDPEMRALALSWIGEEYLEIPRRSMIWSHGIYTRYPFQANTYGLPPEIAYECVQGFVKAHLDKLDPDNKDRPPPRTFEEFCLRHFGEGISRHFMIPYNARLWGVPPSEITADWCSRFVPIPKIEDVLAGAVGLNDRELGYNAKFVYPVLGIGELSRGLSRAVPQIELGRAPRSIDWRRRELVFEDEVVRYDALISTLPLSTLLSITADLPGPVAHAASLLRCTHLYYLDVALNGPCQKPLHWVYVPEAKYPFYRVGCYSNFSRLLAPPGKASLYVELADRSEPDLQKLLPEVADALVEMGLIDVPHAIRFARVRRIDHAYVIFDHHYFPALDVIRPFLEEAGIVSTGRYGGWNYSSMEDALRFGQKGAVSAREMLGGAR